jgi:hypothetical protein
MQRCVPSFGFSRSGLRCTPGESFCRRYDSNLRNGATRIIARTPCQQPAGMTFRNPKVQNRNPGVEVVA